MAGGGEGEDVEGGEAMGRAIIKLNDGKRDWYLEWSTVVDAPVTYGMSLKGLKAHEKSN